VGGVQRLRRAAVGLLGLVALVAGSMLLTPAAQSATWSGPGLLIADNMNRRLLITDLNGQVVWEMNNPTGESSKYAGPLGVRWMTNGRILATFGTGEVGVINVRTKTWVWKTKGFHQDWFQSPYDAQILPDNNLAVATRYNEGGRVAVYNRATGDVVWKVLLSNAHSLMYRNPAQSFNTDLPTLLIGGFGSDEEITYQPGSAPQVVWSASSEYTHDILPLPNSGGDLLTSEGYYIRRIHRAPGAPVWRQDTPDEDRRFALNPNGGFIVSSGEGDVIEFRNNDGTLDHSWHTLSDGSELNYPYGIRVIDLSQVPVG
jgi:hypothetical protein